MHGPMNAIFSTYLVRKQISQCCTSNKQHLLCQSYGTPVNCVGEMKLFMFFRKIAKIDYYLLHVCLSVRMEKKIGSHRTDFHDI